MLGLANSLQGRRLCSKRRKDVVVKFKYCIIKGWDASKQMKHRLCKQQKFRIYLFDQSILSLRATFCKLSFFIQLSFFSKVTNCRSRRSGNCQYGSFLFKFCKLSFPTTFLLQIVLDIYPL